MEYPDLAAASQPDAVRRSLADKADELRGAGHGHHDGGQASVRTVSYKGHDIVIRTTYEITVDGQPFDANVSVDNSGRVHYHGLPTRNFPSTVDLVKKVIDAFPDEFDHGPPPDSPTHDHGDDHGEDHDPGHDHGGHH